MHWIKIFLIVTGCALAGMAMGGAFGYGAGWLAPGMFRQYFQWQDVEPANAAAVVGATAGVLLGGALGCFGILMQWAFEWRKRGGAG